MPDLTYLHIQGQDSDPTRVLAMPGASVRIGRGAQCEIRLGDPELSDVQCLARRRGDAWHVQPVGPAGLVTIEGQAVEHLRPWPLGVPLQVGAYRLVLRSSEWGSYEAPIEVGAGFKSQRAVDPRPLNGARPGTGETDAEVERLRRWQTRLEQRERWLQDRQQEKTWEARWRAAGEGLRARSSSSTSPVRPAPSPARPEVVRPEPRRLESLTSRASAPIVPNRIPPAPNERAPAPLPSPIRLSDEDRFDRPGIPSQSPATRPRLLSLPAPVAPIAVEPTAPIEERAASIFEAETEAGPTPTSTESMPFVADAWAASTDFWHKDTVTTHAPPEPEPRVKPRRESSPQPATSPIDRGEFPSARAIFAAQGQRPIPDPTPSATARKRARGRPLPTDPTAPEQWSIPGWLAAPPAFLAAVGAAVAGLFLGVAWTKDNQEAGLATRAALRTEAGPPVPLDPTVSPETRWWKTTAGHMAHWALAIERSPEGPERAAEVRAALDAASRAAPLDREVRYALALPVVGEEGGSPARAVGLSRDVVTLTLTGRTLKRAGKAEPSIRAYRRALEIAADIEAARLDPPVFDDDSQVRRYRLPREGLATGVIRDIVAAGDWPFEQWSAALPPRAVVRLASARVLREQGSPDADKALDFALASEVIVPSASSPAIIAEHHAAQGEALALRDRRSEAAERYRKAIELAPDDPTRRRWRLGLAEILAPLGASKERAEMLEAAKGPDPNEEVTRKALDAQKFAGLK